MKVAVLIIGVLLSILAGMFYGLNQVVRHHYSLFQSKYPDHNEMFWGPNQWLNKYELDDQGKIIEIDHPGLFQPKYKEKYWGSSRWFVVFTDAHHLTMALFSLFWFLSAICLSVFIFLVYMDDLFNDDNEKEILYILLFIGGYILLSFIKGAGFEFIHSYWFS